MKNFRILQVLSVFLFLLFSSSLTSAAAKILVISCHPDDDILTASGVVYRAAQRGDSVKVVYMTNGDYTGLNAGLARQGEAVNAQAYLGITESSLMFLGYPDGFLNDIYTNYTTTNQIFTAPTTSVSATYGNRGLGSTDYHFYKFGSHASYNRPNILQDLESIITDFKPDHIFTLSEFDSYSDHYTTYALMKLAVTTVMTKDLTYIPTIHKTCVWYNSWLNPIDATHPIDPTSFFPEIPNLLGLWGLNWSDRESLDVPLVMQSTKYMTNKKFLAIAAHESQGGVKSYGQFIHKDEIFWTENYAGSNTPPVPNAGLDQSVSEGVMVQLDGSGSHDPDNVQLNFHWVQAGGIPVTLSNKDIVNPTFNAPTGLKQDEVLTFELVVTDGNLSSVPDSVNVIVRATNPDPYANRNIAPYALVTASSENPQAGQLATKAVDGVIDGSGAYPGDVTKEWVTLGEKSGAWIQLNWSSPYKVNRVTLYDRPNSCEQILTATLNFSDGTTLSVGPLDNFGGATEYTFTTPITVTNLRMTVTAVSGCTQNIGLAEIEVYGVPAGMQDSQTTISSSTPDPSTFGSPVTFTATVTSGATGTVTFKSDGLPLAGGIVTLPSGTSNIATFSTSALTGGTHSITAVYNGDTYHNPSTSNTLSRTVNKPATTTNVASSPNPSTYGSPATFTATVTPSTATGTVTFMDNGASLGIGNLSGGTATLITSPSLSGGTHSITAVYGGDTNYVGSTSSPYAHTVSKANQTISNLASSLTKTFGDSDFAPGATASSNLPVSYTSSNTLVATIVSNQVHIVAGGTVTITASQVGDTNYNAAPNVTQTLTVNRANQTISNLASSLTKTFGDADYAPGATASSGLTVSYASSNTAVATISGSNIHVAGVGSATITASQAGNANYNAAPNVTQNLTVKPAPTSTSISAPAIKSGENGTVAVTVISGILMPTGNVYLTVDKGTSKEATQIGSVTTSGTATFTITSPSPGTHTLDATYNAQGNFGASSASGQLSVDLVVTTTTITPPAPVTYGANGSVTVTVSSGAGTPAGSVSLKVDSTTLPAQVLNNGSTTFTITSPNAGSRALSASYTAQGNFGASSTIGTLIVNKANQTISNLAPSLTKTFGDSDFAPGATANSGLAVSYASSNTLVATIVNNQIHIVAVGAATITASQTGDTNYNAAPNVTQTLTVNRAQTITSVASLSPTSTYGSSVTFTATVTPSTATGTVAFMNGTDTLGTGSLSGGTATLTTSSLGGGIHSITAVYGGDANFAASTTLSGIKQDVLPDGKLDGGSDVVGINDALKALRIAAGIDPLGPSDLVHGDVGPLVNGNPNPDGKIDLDDVVAIMRKAVNLPSW